MPYIAILLAVVLNGLSLYFVFIALAGLRRPPAWPPAAPRTRFAVVIPARNEEAVIGALVDSLHRQDYPRALFDIYVAPNNCSDDTAGAALGAGARLLLCPGPVHRKGDVLHHAAAVLMNAGYDALCVFDADNVADPGFLRAMNDALCAGARVAKGRTAAKNPLDSWVAGCYDLYFGFFDLFFNRPRARLGLSANLLGTGFAVHRTVLEELGGWNTHTVTEDAEFAALCAAAGHRVCWVPGAVAYDEQPLSFGQSLTQRQRWCSGVMQVAGCRLSCLRRALRGCGGLLALDCMLFLLMPFAGALSPLPALLALWTALAAGSAALLSLLRLLLLTGLVSYLGAAGLAAFVALVSGRGKKVTWYSVAAFPLFMASWLPLQVISLFRKTTQWKEIRHTGGVIEQRAA